MTRSNSLANRSLLSNESVFSVLQAAMYLTAFAVWIACIYATTEFAQSPFDIFLGLIASSALATSLITLITVFPIVMKRR